MRKFLILLAAATAFGVVHVGTAYAAPCGTVTANTTLSASCDAPLTVAASGITIDLNGHAVVCNAAVDGIVIPTTTSSAHIRNGTVTSGSSACVNGISVLGNRNWLSSVSVDHTSGPGVHVGGDSNRLTSMSADHAGNNGFVVFGSFNVISGSSATDNLDDGFGAFVGHDNAFFNNLAAHNGDKGIIAGADDTRMIANRVVDNVFGIFLADASTGSSVMLNSVRDNTTGIHIQMSTSNLVVLNRSRGNALDMRDDNADCDANIWAANFFDTRNQPCIH